MKFNINTPTSIKQFAAAILMIIPILTLAQSPPNGGINRTPWEMNRGAGWSQLGFTLSSHGEISAYANASIPATTDLNWGPAPNGETIGFSESSILPGYCLEAVDYTYFQTFVNVPTNTSITQFTIDFSGIDDGGRVTVFNSDYPTGIVIPGSYVFLSESGTTNLADYVTTGQNRVVVTQVDDCPTGNNLQSAIVVLNGLAVPTCSVGEEQTFTILGANGSQGDIDPYTQALPEGATEWQQAYLTGWHPWGFITGTNSWVNFDPNDEVGLNTRTPYRIRFEVPEDFTDPSMVFQIKADNRAIIWINDTYIDSIDGSGTTNVADAIVDQALHAGVNEIRITMVDWGGIVGLNYRIDVTMTSCQDISDAVLTPGEAAALNNPPLAEAGPNQAIETASVNLDGSGSSDPDGNLLSYSWSENGNVIATGISPTITLEDGSHTITLTVSDGELSATDQVIVDVVTNVAPIADAGDDQLIPCGVGILDVTLDGSGSSDPDGDVLTYSWTLGGSGISTAASFTVSLAAGTYTYTLTVDDGNGETATDDVLVTVVADTEAPAITAPDDVTVYANVAGGFSGDIGSASVSDDCDTDPDVSNDAPAVFGLGSTEVTWTATDAASNSASATQIVTVEAYPVIVDIKPGNDHNPVNPRNKGVIPVAILTTDDFDALTIDVGSLSFGPGGTGAAHGGHSEDVDGDGNLDLMLHFSTQGSGVSKDDTELCLEGLTVDGVPMAGCDAINTTGGGRAKKMVDGAAPNQFALQQNYPNPFNPTTSISYDIADAGLVRLTVYNLVGQEVAQLVNGHQSAGRYQISFDAGHMSNGMYFYILEAGEQRFINKMTLMK